MKNPIRYLVLGMAALVAASCFSHAANAQPRMICEYNASQPTLFTGAPGAIQCDVKGNIRTVITTSGDTSAVATGNNVGDGSLNSLNRLFVYSANELSNGTSWDWMRSVPGATAGLGGGVLAVADIPNSSANSAIVPAKCTAVCGSLIVKAAAGNLYRVAITTGASAGYLMVFDATTPPADGTVTPVLCRAVAANASLDVSHAGAPDRYSTGITAVFSTTGCFTKTISATAAIEAMAM